MATSYLANTHTVHSTPTHATTYSTTNTSLHTHTHHYTHTNTHIATHTLVTIITQHTPHYHSSPPPTCAFACSTRSGEGPLPRPVPNPVPVPLKDRASNSSWGNGSSGGKS